MKFRSERLMDTQNNDWTDNLCTSFAYKAKDNYLPLLIIPSELIKEITIAYWAFSFDRQFNAKTLGHDCHVRQDI